MKRSYLLMIAACAVLLAAAVACNKEKTGASGIEASLAGVWENEDIDSDIMKLKLNADGTGEILYRGFEMLRQDCSMRWRTADGRISMEILGFSDSIMEEMAYSLDGNGNLHLTFEENGLNIDYTFSKADGKWEYGVTNILAGDWETDDSYDKFYLEVEEIEYMGYSVTSKSVYVDPDGTQHCCKFGQDYEAKPIYNLYEMTTTESFHISLSNPVWEGNRLKVTFEDSESKTATLRTLKPMDRWPYKTYDELFDVQEKSKRVNYIQHTTR